MLRAKISSSISRSTTASLRATTVSEVVSSMSRICRSLARSDTATNAMHAEGPKPSHFARMIWGWHAILTWTHHSLALRSAHTLGFLCNETPERRTLPQSAMILALLVAIFARHILNLFPRPRALSIISCNWPIPSFRRVAKTVPDETYGTGNLQIWRFAHSFGVSAFWASGLP